MTNEKIKTPDGSHSFWDVFIPGAKLGMQHFDKYDKDYVYVQMPDSKAKSHACLVVSFFNQIIVQSSCLVNVYP